MPINQPSNQIRLTNVSLVRMKKGKKKFELACYNNKIQDYRSGVEKDLDEVLQIHQVFLNVSKGLVAPHNELVKAFQKSDIEEIILEILNKGEIQLNEKERDQKIKQITNEIVTLISTKCVNPNTKKRYSPSMILKTLNQLKYHILPTKPAKVQALDAIKVLVSKQIIPIARAQMEIKIDSDLKFYKSHAEKIKSLIENIENETFTKDRWECFALIDPANYKELKTFKFSLEVLDAAVISTSEGKYK
ncbi:guanine nucleotide exchange factor SDO1 [Ascoidea rubescens DSM 1968]|uniref:Ribosome maturation protein SDO1 n=1 Tax=Ascoidea rubescens DSM 1968 TaxID=1344418 RepID=A0A1D2VA65_9ASCO|nr:SBDS multi-domain protein [Ascoidea rubescens DSM 1968]ODV58562.1 SBDS multi-domain protein [Ascoidea rubescens DSM 1968]